MSRLTRILCACGLGSVLVLGVSCGVGAQNLPNSTYDNPGNNPIRNANPNSRQGTEPSTPPIHGPSTAPNPRPPTLENGGVGNGYSVPSRPARQDAAPAGNSGNSGQRKPTN
jgi:hypothetical protein